jgi:hypothetical protein
MMRAKIEMEETNNPQVWQYTLHKVEKYKSRYGMTFLAYDDMESNLKSKIIPLLAWTIWATITIRCAIWYVMMTIRHVLMTIRDVTIWYNTKITAITRIESPILSSPLIVNNHYNSKNDTCTNQY